MQAAELKILPSEKVKQFIEKTNSQWLINLIEKIAIKNKITSFSVWKLFVDMETSGGLLKVEDGPSKMLDNIPIKYTQFPIEYFELWIVNDRIILPEEY